MGRTRAMACVFLFVSLFVQATIEVSSTSSHLTPQSQYLMPFVEREKYQISRKCKLHPDNDIFRDQEQHKIHLDVNEWRCGYCKKIFRAEKFLDQHYDNRHYDLLNVNTTTGLSLVESCHHMHTTELCIAGLSLAKGPKGDTHGQANIDRFIRLTGCESHSKCVADLCGALHCDLVMDSNSKFRKTKCNPAAAARNRHLCESLADSCFPVNQSPSANRLHELFLRQFCDAHTCSGGRKPFSRGGQKHTSILYLAISILVLMFLPIFYVIVYLYQREMKKGTQELKRISQLGRKTKPS
ncbi:hypothetical protein TEA_023883 [Camellia sinensis var. sinensis]|uniref:C2H2-type domain-containing protein n=1 Tax=Camellia sinensis var. sinensis TaxID=542762 RepID=A0A4S4DZQ4_CAMSN|nr:hypothetical protein TEA_023883 [Camellia sinensis var. sinensis]